MSLNLTLMYLLLVLSAAISFGIGGIYMKLSQGLSQLLPSFLVYLFFTTGASFQTIAIHNSDLGITYLLVLGLESVFALLSGVMLFQEDYSFLQLLGASLVIIGIIFLRADDI